MKHVLHSFLGLFLTCESQEGCHCHNRNLRRDTLFIDIIKTMLTMMRPSVGPSNMSEMMLPDDQLSSLLETITIGDDGTG